MLWLEDILLRDGFYSTVNTGETDIYGRDISLLQLSEDESFPDNTVYQSAFKYWVHESGIQPSYSIAAPLLVSGVTVDGTFYPKDSAAPGYNATFAHRIDFRNGRILFNNPIAANSVVQAEFSYKHVAVEFTDRFENELEDYYFQTSYKDNPQQTGVITYPIKNSVTLPAITIDFRNSEALGYELGSAVGQQELRGTFHIWTADSADKDMIEDLILSKTRSVLPGIDFNAAPMPLDMWEDKNPAFTSYEDLAVVGGPYFWHRIYIEELKQINSSPFQNIERGRIDFLIRVYANF